MFTVPVLEDAVDHAVDDRCSSPSHGGWEGRFVVVVGPGQCSSGRTRHLTEPG